MEYRIVFTKRARKDAEKLENAGLKQKAMEIISIIKYNPYRNPPRYEKLIGDLDGMYSRRLNIKHRIVYAVHEEERVIKILSMWTHYE